MLMRMVLKRVLDEMGELGNATKKQSADWLCGIR